MTGRDTNGELALEWIQWVGEASCIVRSLPAKE